MGDFSGVLHILALKCATAASTGSLFWLPRDRYVEWAHPPQPGGFVTTVVPGWLAAKHRQLVGHVEFERVRDSNLHSKGSRHMADRDMTRTLSKNTRKEKPSHADYTGSIIIDGRKYWLNGWVKLSQDGERKFLSLSLRPAEERSEANPKTTTPARAMAGEDIPFAPEWR